MNRPQVAIIGAGVVGLAHAWSAAERGFQVTVYERSERASGASIRNFGMVWPIGQPHGENYEIAMLSRARWMRLSAEAGVWVNPCGSIHLAHRDDEWQVLEEFHSKSEALGISCELLTPAQVHRRTPAANPDGLQGGLFSPTECCVNPPEVIRSLPAWLAAKYGISFRMGTHVSSIESSGPEAGARRVQVTSSRGDAAWFERAVVCCGAEMQSLFPQILGASGLKLCKLQMLSLQCPGRDWTIGTHLASGLTLRHYRIFEVCPSLTVLKTRIAEESPELDRFGIHVMASQNDCGEIILGDSHEYGVDIEPFDKALIDELMLRELRKVFRFPGWAISQRWHGVYAKHPLLPVYEASPAPGIHICTGTGGAGMTMSFGLAETIWRRWSMLHHEATDSGSVV